MTLADCPEDKTIAEFCGQFEMHPNQIIEWKRQVMERFANAFGGASEQKESVDLVPLYAKIGQLTLESDFFEHALAKAGLLSAKS